MAFYYQSAPYHRMFTLVQSANHVLALTGATATTIVSKAGASFIYCDVAAVEVATGWYRLPLTTTTTNTVGDLAFHVTALNADDRDWVDQVLAGVQVATVVQSVKDDLVSQVWATPVRALGTAGQTAVSQETTNAVWATGVRTLSQAAYDQLVNQVWATPVRTITGGGSAAAVDTTAVIAIASGVWDQQRSLRNASGSFGNLVQTFGVTVATNSDKTSYTLTQAAYDQLTNQIWATAVRSVTAGTITTVTGSVGSVASPVGVGSNYDKTGYTLTQAAYDQAVNQVWATPVRTVTSVTGAVGSVASPVGVSSNYDKTGYTLTQAAYDQLVNQVWATPVRSVTAGTVTTVTGAVGSVASPVGASSVYDKTGYALTTTEEAAIADAFLNRDMSTGVDSGSDSVRTARQALRFLRNKWSISGVTLTVTKEDDATTSWTSALATAATSDPVVGSDPTGP